MEYDLYKRAKLRCMHLLERRDYTEKQLRDKLKNGKTQYSDEMIDEALAYVKSYRYVDDARYARQYIECMQGKKSRRQIEQELMQKGVARELTAQAFEEAELAPEEELIQRWLQKKQFDPSTADLKERQKMYAFLMRKGFPSDKIYPMLQGTEYSSSE